MDNTKIGWTHRLLPDGKRIPGATYNPWWGCIKVSPGCQKCYAEGVAHHYKQDVWGPAQTTARRFFGEKHWAEPLKWNRLAEKDGHRRSVFCASMADVFEENDTLFEPRERLWTLIDQTPWLNWLLLTKRPENIFGMLPDRWRCNDILPDNLWLGTSVENQEYADKRIPLLLDIPAAVRFISYEPALGPVDFTPYIESLHWLIIGGESGIGARPFNLDWARSVRQQILTLREQQNWYIPLFFKQIGGRYHDSGGRLLDGRTWDEMPPEFPTIHKCEICEGCFFAHMGYHEEENKSLGTLQYSYCQHCCQW